MKLIAAVLIGGATVGAQAAVTSEALGQQAPASPVPIRELGPVSARTTTALRAAWNVRALPDGRVLVNDGIARQLYLFDADLNSFAALRDSASGSDHSYGPRATVVVPFVGNASLFVDNASQTLVVIDSSGTFGRVMAPPNPRDLLNIARPGAGTDARGRLVYEGAPLAPPSQAFPDQRKSTRGSADSAPILRANFDTRTVDTVTRVLIKGFDGSFRAVEGRRTITTYVSNPLKPVDGWAITSDGSIALVRGHDYHVDWINPDGSRTSSPKLPYAWRRLTDGEKQRTIDSARATQWIADSTAQATRQGMNCFRNERHRDVRPDCISVVERGYVPLAEMPDYYPPLREGAVRADLDNNIWILPTTTASSANGDLVYEVVNRKGELAERVRVPATRTIAGFGRGGIVYLTWRDSAAGGWLLERRQVARPASGRP